jgi:hypothetical protein
VDRHPGPGELRQIGQGLDLKKPLGGEERAEARGVAPAQGAAQLQGLAGHHGAVVLARMQGVVGVVDPGHGLLVGVEVGRRDVRVGADVVAQFVHEAAGDAPELGLAEALGIAHHPAFGAAERHLHQRALPGHEGRQGGDLMLRHLGVIADAALAGPEHVVVQHPVALEGADRAVLHLDRKAHADGALGRLEKLDQAALETGQVGPRPAELLALNLEGIGMLDRAFRCLIRFTVSVHI